jgi:hypothetical protein
MSSACKLNTIREQRPNAEVIRAQKIFSTSRQWIVKLKRKVPHGYFFMISAAVLSLLSVNRIVGSKAITRMKGSAVFTIQR